MADFDFSEHISHVAPGEPVWNTLKTEMEGMRVKTRLKSTLPKRTWELELFGLSASERLSVLAHYNGQYGGTVPFNWVSMPSWIGNEQPSVLYTSYKENVVNAGIWEISITFTEFL